MKVRCAMLGDEVFPAALVEAASMMSRSDTSTVLEIDTGAPLQIDPPGGDDVEVVEATADEWRALEAAGYVLRQGSSA